MPKHVLNLFSDIIKFPTRNHLYPDRIISTLDFHIPTDFIHAFSNDYF